MRWAKALSQWRLSMVSRAIFPCVMAVFVWAYTVAKLLPVIAPAVAARAAQMWIPLSLQGTAIGLLLVFRTNNAYLRLAEAREQKMSRGGHGCVRHNKRRHRPCSSFSPVNVLQRNTPGGSP